MIVIDGYGVTALTPDGDKPAVLHFHLDELPMPSEQWRLDAVRNDEPS